MTAKEMFEKLGYELKKNTDLEIWYYNAHTKPVETNITFVVQSKCFCIYKPQICNSCIDIHLLQAINKQIEELRWNKC